MVVGELGEGYVEAGGFVGAFGGGFLGLCFRWGRGVRG